MLGGQAVASILEDRDGTVWAGGVPRLGTGRLCTIRAGKGECFGQDGSLGRGVLCLYEGRKGNLWAGAFSGLWLWKPRPPKRYPMPETISDLIESNEGELLMLMPGGVRRLESGKARPYPMGGPSIPRTALNDRDGGLWIGTPGQGLLHVPWPDRRVFAHGWPFRRRSLPSFRGSLRLTFGCCLLPGVIACRTQGSR